MSENEALLEVLANLGNADSKKTGTISYVYNGVKNMQHTMSAKNSIMWQYLQLMIGKY